LSIARRIARSMHASLDASLANLNLNWLMPQRAPTFTTSK
jgi:hypothetical protein